MNSTFALSIMTRDRVGIVADITTALRNLNGNLADLSQTVLRGYFTMIVIASFPENVSAGDIRAEFATLSGDDPFEVGVKPFEPNKAGTVSAGRTSRHVLSVSGPDRVGFVAAVSQELVRWSINIDDIASTVRDGQYVMFLLLELPVDLSMNDFRKGLDAATADIGAVYQLQHDDIFRATNEIG
ncbi:MAG: glycine cleavage system protein R [Verrucomicrobiota bacterium]